LISNGVGGHLLIPQDTRCHFLSPPYCTQIWPSYRISQTPFQKNFRVDHSSRTVGHLPLPRFLYRVYVLIAVALGEYWVIDRPADPKGKLQLTVL
jgi:hypothetical protein